MNKRLRQCIVSLVAVFLLGTCLALNPIESLSVAADGKGNYYNQTLNTLSDTRAAGALKGSQLSAPDLSVVSKSPYESYLLDGYVEDNTQRERNLKVFVKGDIEKRLYFLSDVHEMVNGKWEDIDLTFKPLTASLKSKQTSVSTSTYRSVIADTKKLTLKDDASIFNLETTSEDTVIPTQFGYLVQKTLTTDTKIQFTTEMGVDASLNSDNRRVVITRGTKDVAILNINVRSQEYSQTAGAPELILEKTGVNVYTLSIKSNTALKPDTPFDIDLEVAVVDTYDETNVKLFGVRNGPLYVNNSYNPKGHVSSNSVVIGNGDYNGGYIFCSGSCYAQSSINYGIVSFFNDVDFSQVVDSSRTVRDAKLVLNYATNVNANDGKGIYYQAYMLDPSKNFDVSNERNITYTNFQNYLNNSTTIPYGSEVLGSGHVGTLAFDITEIAQNWEVSGNHHGILIKAERNGSNAPLSAAHYFPNHVSTLYPGKLPHIEITTIKKAPVSPDYNINDTTLNLRPFTVNKRDLNVVEFMSLGFDGLSKPESVVEVEVRNESNVVFSNAMVALNGYRRFPQYSQELGYDTVENTQTYYRLTSNYQLPQLLKKDVLAFNTLYQTHYKTHMSSDSTDWKSGDSFILVKVSAYDRLPRLLAFYGITDKVQFMQDNNMSDDLLVEGNILFVRNPQKNQTQTYQPAELSDDDKRMIDNNLLGRNQHCVYGYEPINFNTGNFVYSNTDTGSIDYDTEILFERFYNSLAKGKVGVFGRNWTLGIYKELYFLANGSVEYSDGTGRIMTFEKDGVGYKRPFNTYLSLEKYELNRETVMVDSGYYDQEGSPVQTPEIRIQYGYRITDASENSELLFDGVGNVRSYKPNQYLNPYTYEYQDGVLQAIITPAHRRFEIVLNDLGLIKHIVDPEGNTVSYGYDDALNLVTFIDQSGYTINYTYDDASHMLTYTGRELGDTVITNTYDSEGRIVAQKDALGQEAQFKYYADYTEITDYKHEITRVYKNEMGYTTVTQDPGLDPCIKEYDSFGNVIRETTASGVEVRYTYDTNNRRISETDAFGNIKTMQYDTRGNIVKITDFNGEVTRFEYDLENRKTATYYPNGTSEIKHYNSDHQVSYEKDMYGFEKTYTYTAGSLTLVSYSDGTAQSYTYTLLGSLETHTDEAGKVTTYTYDERNLLMKETSGTSTHVMTYDGDGQRVSVVDGELNRTNYVYDAWSRIKEIVTVSGVTSYTYDENGNVTEIKNALRNVETYEYNTQNRLVSKTDALNRTTTYAYDTQSRLVKETDPAGRVKTYTYNDQGKLETETFMGLTQTYAYDLFGNVTETVDGYGNRTHFVYDVNGRLIETTDSNHLVTQYRYNGSRLIEKEVNGHVWYYEYTQRGQEVKTIDPLNRVHTKTYASGLVVEMDASGQTQLTYDYDANSLVSKETDALGNYKQYFYDTNLNKIKEIDANGGITLYEYNHMNQEVRRQSPEGYVRVTEYDALGRKATTESYDVINNDVAITVYTYDAVGNLITMTDPIGRVTTYTYDVLNQVTDVDQSGRLTHYVYDDMGRVITEDSFIKSTYYTYNDKGLLETTSDSLGFRETLTYDIRGKVVKSENECGEIETFEYDDMGYITKTTNARGLETHYEVNILGATLKETDALGVETVHRYNAKGQLEASSYGSFESTLDYDIRGYVTKQSDSLLEPTYFEYDAVGNVKSTTTGSHTSHSKYDLENRLIETRDALDNKTTYRYNQRNQVVEITYADTSRVQYQYDLAGRRILSVDQLGYETAYTYNVYDALVSETNALGDTIYYEYDVRGNQTKRIEPNNVTTQSIYDARNRVIKVISPNGAVTETTYTDFDAVETVVYPNGLKKIYTYDTHHDLISEHYEGKDNEVTYTYDRYGRVVSTTDSRGNRTETVYDIFGNPTETTTNQNVTVNEYDAYGRLIGTVDARGYEVTYTYNSYNQKASMTDNLGYEVTYTYDLEGRLTHTTDELGSLVTTYDALGRVASECDRLNQCTTYTYSLRGERTTTKTPLGSTTEQHYDALGRVVRETDALGNEKLYEYDANHNVSAYQDTYGTVMRYGYDAEGNRKETRYQNESVEKRAYDTMNRLVRIETVDDRVDTIDYDIYGNKVHEITNSTPSKYVYDTHNRLLEMTTGDIGVRYDYDSLGNIIGVVKEDQKQTFIYNAHMDLVEAIDSNKKSVIYSYDIKGRQTSIVYPDGKQVLYEYDTFGRLHSVSDGQDTTVYEYDKAGNVTSEITGSLETQRTYDSDNNLLSQHVTQEGVVISELTYERNELGNVLKETSVNTETSHTKTYVYDALNQVVKYQKVSENGIEAIDFEYDFKGNKTKETVTQDGVTSEKRYVTNLKHQLVAIIVADNRIDMTYDKKGNLVSKVHSNGLQESYTYDDLNQLIEVKDSEGHRTSYTYDALGDRVKKREETPYSMLSTRLKTQDTDKGHDISALIASAKEATLAAMDNQYTCTLTTLNDTTRIVEEMYVNDITKANTEVLSVYRNDEVYASYVNSYTRLKTEARDETKYTLVNGKFDIIGSVSDKETQWIEYDHKGVVLTKTSERFGYSSESHDGGLQYLRARYYDTETGIFISKDTYRGSQYGILSQNGYIYTENNAVNSIDPSGHMLSNILNIANTALKTVASVASKVSGNDPRVQNLNKVVSTVSSALSLGSSVGKAVTDTHGIKPTSTAGKYLGHASYTPSIKEQIAERQKTVESKKQDLAKQVHQQRLELKQQGYSELEIAMRNLELVKKYCDTFGLTEIDLIGVEAYREKLNKPKELPNAGTEISEMGSTLTLGGLGLTGVGKLISAGAPVAAGLDWLALLAYSSYTGAKDALDTKGYSVSYAISMDPMQNINEYLSLTTAEYNGYILPSEDLAYKRILEGEIQSYEWITLTSIQEMVVKASGDTKESTTGNSITSGNTSTPDPDDKDKKGEGTGNSLSADELKNIGTKGDNSGIRHVNGSAQDARAMFDNQVLSDTVKEVQPGVFVGQGADGFTYTFRASSVSGPPTIDVNGIPGLRKIKFIP